MNTDESLDDLILLAFLLQWLGEEDSVELSKDEIDGTGAFSFDAIFKDVLGELREEK